MKAQVEASDAQVFAGYDYYYYKTNTEDRCADYDAFRNSRLMRLFENLAFTSASVVFQYEEFLTGQQVRIRLYA